MINDIMKRLSELPNVTLDDGQEYIQLYDAMETVKRALEQEPSGDLISRQAVLDIDFKRIILTTAKPAETIEQKVKALPPVTPKSKTGHWIEKDGFDGDVYYDCSECGESWTTIEGTPWNNEWNYCPNCGCRMVEPQKSEDKE